MKSSAIQDVSDTAYWIAHQRSLEDSRPDALFRDPLAGRLAGERGRDISAAMPEASMVGWTVAIRTHVIDSFIASELAQGTDTVLNLGAGLDARPYRMDLPASLRWIEADSEQIIAHKEAALAGEQPRCRLERVKLDITNHEERTALFERVAAQSARVLVITEGVVPYLTVEEAAPLADDLRAQPRFGAWIVDYFSPEAMKYRRLKRIDRHMGKAPFRFEPENPFSFFAAHGWRPREVRYFVPEGERLGRTAPLSPRLRFALKFWSMLMPRNRREAFRHFGGYVLLEPNRTETLAADE